MLEWSKQYRRASYGMKEYENAKFQSEAEPKTIGSETST